MVALHRHNGSLSDEPEAKVADCSLPPADKLSTAKTGALVGLEVVIMGGEVASVSPSVAVVPSLSSVVGTKIFVIFDSGEGSPVDDAIVGSLADDGDVGDDVDALVVIVEDTVGSSVGLSGFDVVKALVGEAVGSPGVRVGLSVVGRVGNIVGASVGLLVGGSVDAFEGAGVVLEEAVVGVFVGVAVGLEVSSIGATVGISVLASPSLPLLSPPPPL